MSAFLKDNGRQAAPGIRSKPGKGSPTADPLPSLIMGQPRKIGTHPKKKISVSKSPGRLPGALSL